jgi:phosphate transport system substrate-binding protein
MSLLGELRCNGQKLDNRLVLTGAGATFPEQAWNQWTKLFESTRVSQTQSRANVAIEYTGVGSGRGKSQLMQGVVDFAGTDALLTDDEDARDCSYFQC